MSKYKATFEGYVIREDGAKIPLVNSELEPNTHKDFKEYEKWLDEGNVPDAPDPGSEPIPSTVKLWQARIILHEMGLLAKVESLLKNLPEPDKTRALSIWEYASTVERDNKVVQLLAAALPLSEAELDNLFLLAFKV